MAIEKTDLLTRVLSKIFDLLTLHYPRRTTFGVVTGMTMKSVFGFYPQLLDKLAIARDGVTVWNSLFIGITIMHLRTIIGLFRKEPLMDESVEAALEMIRIAEKEGVSIEHRRIMIIAMCHKAIGEIPEGARIPEELQAGIAKPAPEGTDASE